MEILGVGPLELIFIFMIALIVLGPQDMKKTGKTLGRFLRKIVTSQGWREFQQGWRNLRYLPNKLMREAGLEEDMKTLNESMKEIKNLKPSFDFKELDQTIKETENDISSWLKPPTIDSPPPPGLEAVKTAAAPEAISDATPDVTPAKVVKKRAPKARKPSAQAASEAVAPSVVEQSTGSPSSEPNPTQTGDI